MRLSRVIAMGLAVGLLGTTAACAGGDGVAREPGPAAAAPGIAGSPGAATSPAGSSGSAGSTGSAGPATDVPPGPAVVPASLQFSGKTVAGKQFDAASLAGKPVVLWFWAPWCATCAGQAASIRDMAAAHADKVGILGVAGLGEERAMRDFVTEFRLQQVTQLSDPTGKVWRKFEVTQQSTFVFLDPAGNITHRGWLDSLDFETQVARMAGRA